MVAQKKRNKEIVKLLIDNPKTDLNIIDKKGKSLLTLSYNDEDLFKILVHRDDINLNVINKKGFTPLHNAVKLNDFDLVSFILDSKRNKTSIDSRTKDGSSLMHLAFMNKSIKLIKFLEKSGLDFNIQDKLGKTPLMLLFDSHENISDILILVIKNDKLKVNLKDNEGILYFAFFI